MMRQEQKMQQKLYKVDSNAARQLFAHTQDQYAGYLRKLRSDTAVTRSTLSGVYHPYLDSLQGSMSFLQNNPRLSGNLPQVQAASAQLQTLESKMQVATDAQNFIQQRKQQLSNYISTHVSLQNLMSKPLGSLERQTYYYTQQLRQYKEMWDNPDRLIDQALSLLDKLPSFNNFMHANSQLAGLFGVPGGAASTANVAGLQTRDQVSQVIQDQVASGGPGGAGALQSDLGAAQGQLDTYKSKLASLGAGNGGMDMPAFKPNDQKTKSFLKRLQVGFNLQSTHNSYYLPMTTDLGLSLAYLLGHGNDVGIGASYKLGWGNGIRDIAFSSQGVGLRSFVDIKVKGSFSATGGFEYNYTTPQPVFRQYPRLREWTKSGLIGATKSISTKMRAVKKTTLSLLWDFLSYEQIPRTQPFLFRVGYSF
jgi:hypothetical protein